MFCSKCGLENDNSAIFCNHCGFQFSGTKLKRMNVLYVVLLTFVTFGIYFPIWFLKQRDALNNMKSEVELRRGIFVSMIVILSIGLMYTLFSVFAVEYGDVENADAYELVSDLICIAITVMVIVQSYRVRRILNDHMNLSYRRNIGFSGVATFFLTVYFLQYKVNRYLDIEENMPPN